MFDRSLFNPWYDKEAVNWETRSEFLYTRKLGSLSTPSSCVNSGWSSMLIFKKSALGNSECAILFNLGLRERHAAHQPANTSTTTTREFSVLMVAMKFLEHISSVTFSGVDSVLPHQRCTLPVKESFEYDPPNVEAALTSALFGVDFVCVLYLSFFRRRIVRVACREHDGSSETIISVLGLLVRAILAKWRGATTSGLNCWSELAFENIAYLYCKAHDRNIVQISECGSFSKWLSHVTA